MINVNAAHTQIRDVFVHTGGLWAALRGTWIKKSGAWKLALLPFTQIDVGTVTFHSDGTLTGTATAIIPLLWYWPGSSGGIGSSYWIKLQKVSGTGHANIDDGAWHSLASNLTVNNTGAAGHSLSNYFISSDSGGSVIVGTGSVQVDNTV
jgi:hypothetical protein